MSEEGLKKGVGVKFPKKTRCGLAHPLGNENNEDNFADYSCSDSGISEKDNHFSMGVHTHNKRMFKLSTPSSAKSTNHGSSRDVRSNTRTRKPTVDLSKLGMDSLIRYCREYNISGMDSNSTKEQMLSAIQHHFVSQPPLEEEQVIRELLTRLAKET